VKYEKVYGIRWHINIVEQLHNGGKAEKKKVQFVGLQHLLKQGHPMIDFEEFKLFLDFEGRKLPLKTLKLF
jgi:hypothetical protein